MRLGIQHTRKNVEHNTRVKCIEVAGGIKKTVSHYVHACIEL